MKKTLLSLSMALLLSACGGSSSSDNSSGGQQPNPPNPQNPDNPNPPSLTVKKGILTDSPVAGVRYESRNAKNEITHQGLTSSAADSLGQFLYEDGDTVSFFIGDVQLGESINAQEKITPLELSTDQNVRSNLLVLLQSLDQDGDHDNGIQIAEKASEALTNQVLDLKAAPETFASSSVLSQVLSTTQTKLVPVEKAKQNFFSTVLSDLKGSWLYEDEETATKVVIYFDGSGQSQNNVHYINYAFAQTSTTDLEHGSPGMEQGSFAWDPITGEITISTPKIDTNGEWGLSHPAGTHQLTFGATANTIQLKDGEYNVTLTRIEGSANSIVGSWYGDSMFGTFFSDGTYFILNTTAWDCGFPGLEIATYSAASSVLKPTSVSVDGNGCAALVDTGSGYQDLDSFSYTVSNQTLTTQYEGEEPQTFKRL